MFINYRKMAQSAACLAVAAGIIVVTFSSGDKDVKNEVLTVETQQNQLITKEDISKNNPQQPEKIKKVVNNGETQNIKGDFQYTIKSGDTLYDLSQRYGVSIAEIIVANDLTTDKLSIGQELLIPISGKYKEAASLKKVAFNQDTKLADNRKVTSRENPKKVVSAAQKVEIKAVISNTRVGEMIPWSKVGDLFPRGVTATVIDVDTGMVFKVKRLQGTYHADCEPLTSNDTGVLKKIYGGSWSWTRRAVVVVVNGNYIAASINGMPHGRSTIDNNFAGHICIHFKGSTTHGSSYTKSGKPLEDPDHQAMVRKAAGEE